MGRNGASSQHNHMVQQVVQHLKQRNYRDIRAVSGGFPRPQPIEAVGGEIAPDVTTVNRHDALQIFEVETAEALEKGHGAQKWSALAHFAARTDGKFWLVVPRGTAKTAEARLSDLRVHAKIWEV